MVKEQQSRKNYLQLFGWALVAVAIVCSLTLWGQRLAAEKAYKTVQVSVNYTDVVSLANGNQLSVPQMLDTLQAHGVSAILFKEVSVGDLDRLGKVELTLGDNLRHSAYADKVSPDLSINDATLYVAILDEAWAEQVQAHLLHKIDGAMFYDGEVPVVAVPVAIPGSAAELDRARSVVTEIGIGYDQEGLGYAAASQMGVIPQMRSWSEEPTDQSLRFVTDELKQMPNVTQILFNDKTIPSGIDPHKLRTFAELLRVDGEPLAPVGTIEFSEQAGLNQLGLLLDKDVIRLHTIANNEMSKLTEPEMLDRWMLAARERNMRSLLVRFMDVYTPAMALDENLAYLDDLASGLEDSGFTLQGTYEKPASINVNGIVMFVIGLGVAAGVLLMLLQMGLPRLAVAGFIITTVCWGGLFALSPILARKLMALAGVMVFPIISCLIFIQPKRQNIGKSIVTLLKMCALSFIGAILMVGLLADVLFMLKLDQFSGVKIAHIIPIIVVPLVLYIWREKDPVQAVKDLFNQAVTYKWAFLAGILVVAAVIYVARTGNTTAELSGAESAMRNFLNDVMGVRPRSKEFLIGYPLTLVMFYFGATRGKWFLSIPAVIGQVSLVNTYAHIHTALIMSLRRSLNGLVLGIVLGVVAIIVIELLLKLYKKYIVNIR